jgi:periplasmic protein TonB
MALTARLDQTRPDTLPADFSEWDGSVDVPATLPEDFCEFDTAPQGQIAVQTTREPANKPDQETVQERVVAAAPIDPMPQPAEIAPKVDDTEFRTRESLCETNLPISAKVESEPNGKSKIKLVGIGIVSLVVLLALVSIIYFRLVGGPSNPKEGTIIQQSTVSNSLGKTHDAQTGSLIKPSPSVPAAPSQSTPVNLGVQANAQPQEDPVQPDSMDTQLNAPARLPRNLHSASDPGTPALGTAVIDDIGNNGAEAVKGVFGTKKAPQVKVDAKPINISAGVAEGRLIRKVTPTYPQIARSARVSGTVVLNAVISKDGIPQGIHASSGPAMLRQAAAEAVKNWRYRPYLLNNQPIEVETTINVIFTIN